MSNILLFPGCASSPDDIEACEQETGLVAVRSQGSTVIRMLPALQLRLREEGTATRVCLCPELPGVA